MPAAHSRPSAKTVAPVEPAVAVGVAQQPDRAERRLAGLGLVGIVAHLGDVEVAVGVEGRGDRALHDRLGRDQLHAEPVHGLECLQCLIRREGRQRLEEVLEQRVGDRLSAGVDRRGGVLDPGVGDAVGRQSGLAADPEQDIARLLEIVEYPRLLGEGSLAVNGHLLVDPRDQVIERIAIVGGLAVEVHVNRVGVGLGVGGAGGRLREGSAPRSMRDDPRRGDGSSSIQAPLPFSAGTACSRTTLPLTISCTVWIGATSHVARRRTLHAMRARPGLADDPARTLAVHFEQEQRPAGDEAAAVGRAFQPGGEGAVRGGRGSVRAGI